MYDRDLSGPGQTRAIRDLLQSLFACELVQPSSTLWLFFAWTSDVEVIDNSARQFASVCPDWPATGIRLSSVLDRILGRGGNISILLREARANDSFILRLDYLRSKYNDRLRYCIRPDFHEKGMLGDDYVLDGSMNLTLRGIEVNDEHITLRCSSSIVAQRRIELRTKWERHLQ